MSLTIYMCPGKPRRAGGLWPQFGGHDCSALSSSLASTLALLSATVELRDDLLGDGARGTAVGVDVRVGEVVTLIHRKAPF